MPLILGGPFSALQISDVAVFLNALISPALQDSYHLEHQVGRREGNLMNQARIPEGSTTRK